MFKSLFTVLTLLIVTSLHAFEGEGQMENFSSQKTTNKAGVIDELHSIELSRGCQRPVQGPAGPIGPTGPSGTGGLVADFYSAYFPGPQTVAPFGTVSFSSDGPNRGITRLADGRFTFNGTGYYKVTYAISVIGQEINSPTVDVDIALFIDGTEVPGSEISEIFTDPNFLSNQIIVRVSDEADFIELKNKLDGPVALTGHPLRLNALSATLTIVKIAEL